MRKLDTTYHYGMAGYLMDFGFGGFIGYGKGVSVELVMEELNIRMKVNVLFPASGNQYKCLPLWQKTKVTKLCQ